MMLQSRLKKKYQEEISPFLKKKLNLKNNMQTPRLKKIIISMGLADAVKDKTAMQDHVNELALLTGQMPIKTKAKKDISNFKLRKGMIIGLKVTLRKKRMYDFFDRFCNIVCPRIRDFRGFAVKFDGSGNYSVGLTDQQAFPELVLDKVKRTQGMNLTFVTSAKDNDSGKLLLEMLGFPFKKNN